MSNSLITKQDAEDIRNMRLKIESFTRIVNSNPRKTTKDFKGNETVPISEIEMALDQLFFYQWEWVDGSIHQFLNSIVVEGVLRVKHPTTGEWLRRTGRAAAALQQDAPKKDSNGKPLETILVTDFTRMKKDAVELATGVADAMALKNAAKKFGKLFGRDIRRKENAISNFEPLIKEKAVDQLKKVWDSSPKDEQSADQIMLKASEMKLTKIDLDILKAYIKGNDDD